jgi:hypothetical protein
MSWAPPAPGAALVIEEVARACAMSSLIPAVNTVGYVKERKQFGRAVAEFQGLQFMLADMAMKLEGARQLTYAAAARSERAMQGEKVDDLTFFSSAAKCLASDVAMSVTTDAVQLLGGYGMDGPSGTEDGRPVFGSVLPDWSRLFPAAFGPRAESVLIPAALWFRPIVIQV